MSECNIDNRQIEIDLIRMDKRLMDLEAKMTSIDSKLTQVVDAILGNALTKTGGFVGEISTMKDKIKIIEEKMEKQDDFRKRILWTIGIIIAVAVILEYGLKIYSNFKN